jgi:hypothetical protein
LRVIGTFGCSDKDDVGVVAATAAAAAAVTTSTNLGLDLHGNLLCSLTVIDERSVQIKMSPLPQLRPPPRTLVLIFIAISSVVLTVIDERSVQIKMSPQRRPPPRTLVLIFIAISCSFDGYRRVVGSDKDGATAVTATTTNLGLDLHIASSSVVG